MAPPEPKEPPPPTPTPPPGLCPITKQEPKPIELAPVAKTEPEKIPGWRRIKVTYDTGAGATVSPKKAFPCKVRESESQKRGVHYIDAGGNRIDNEGEVLVTAQTEEFQNRNVVFQVADVTKPLFCAAESVPAGFKTIIDDEASGGCYMEHKATGEDSA